MAVSNPRNVADLQAEITALDARYTVEKIIGSGSYGVVMRAKDTTDNSLVAIKRINKEIFDESILAKRILREIKLLAHFHDVNIVGLRNILTPRTADFDAFFIVMEIMETDLRAVLKSGQRLSEQHAQFFVCLPGAASSSRHSRCGRDSPGHHPGEHSREYQL
jgi:mitogen-activated protein kinase 1/3